MKKRILAILLTLAVVFSAFSGILVSAVSADVEDMVKSAFNTYISAKGNAATKTGMLTAVNTAISPYTATIASDEDYFIRHAADGVTAIGADGTEFEIEGHDGYSAAVLTISDADGNAVGTVGAIANIPHTVENLGMLTVSSESDFTISGTTVTAYSGTAEMVIIPDGVTSINALAADSTIVAAEVLIVPEGVTTIAKAAFRTFASGSDVSVPTGGWSNLKAVQLPESLTTLGDLVFVRDYSLQYIKMPADMLSGTSKGSIGERCFAYCWTLQNFDLPGGVTIRENAFNETAIYDFYAASATGFYNATNQTSYTVYTYAFGTAKFGEGERVKLSYEDQQTATLTRAATLAQDAADNIVVSADSTADTVKSEITETYSAKNENITAEWSEEPVFNTTALTVDGVLTLSLEGKEIDIDVCNVVESDVEVPEMDYATVSAIKQAFKDYVAEIGNASATDTLVAYINSTITDVTVSIAADDHYFIYHAVDGVYDEDPDESTRLSIPGHDGYVSAVFTVADTNGTVIGTVGSVEVIPHTEENLGVLTKSSESDFTISDGTVTAYSGTAQKVIIPDGVTKISALAKDGTFVNAEVLIVPDSVTSITDAAFRSYATGASGATPGTLTGGWTKLKAVEIRGGYTLVGQNAFVRDYSLKYLKLPSEMQTGSYINYQAFGYCFALENVVMGKWLSLKGYVFRYTPVRSFYQGEGTTITTGEYYTYSNSTFTGGTRSIMTYADQQSATLTRAATLAKEAANKYAYGDGDTADTVKSEIVAGYSAKTLTSAITADWNDTFTVSNGVASGVLTLTQGDYDVDVEYNYNPYVGLNSLSVDGYEISPEFDPETYDYTLSVLGSVNSVNINASSVLGATINFASGTYNLAEGENVFTIDATLTSGTVVTYTLTVTRLEIPTEIINGIEKAFKTYVDNKGNNAEPDALLSYINKAISPASVEYDTDGFFIRHAVDGVYDENDDEYPIEIKGHDGSVAITLKVYNKDGALVSYYGGLNTIPHAEENLGELSYDIYCYDDAVLGLSDFQIDADENIIGYIGDAEKIIIPGDFAGKIAFTAENVTNKDSIKAVVIGGSNTSSMTLNIADSSFSGWESLRAVELPRKIIGRIGQFAFAYNPVLKYVDTPAGINNTSGGYGTFENEAFRDCPVLENINSNNTNGRMTTGQLWSNIYQGTAVRDYIYEGWYQFGSGGSTANIASAPTYTEGTQVILAVGANTGATLTPTFTRAATMAQEKADTLTVTADNADSALTTITGTYSTKLTGVTAEWADNYNELVLTYGNYCISVVCNKVSYNTTIGIAMNTAVDYRFNLPAGIRFSYTVSGLDALLADETVADVKLGTIIAPADLISGEFTHFEMTYNGDAYLDIAASYIKDENTVTTVLSNIKSDNMNREFSAIGYALITYADGTSKYVYANDTVTARPSAVASDILANDSDLTAEEIAVLESIVDTANAYTQNWIDTEYGSSDVQAMTLRNSIVASDSATIDETVYSGTTYYVDESNFATYKSMLSLLPEGSKVLFERGGTYRVGSIAVPNNNIYFGAYGEGAKPNIYGSEKNFAESVWTNESTNIWSVSDVTVLSDNDAGIVIFDAGKKAGTKRATLAEVTADGDFWYDAENDKVYLYSAVNPADTWNSIEIGVNAYIFEIDGKSGITIDNLNIRYTGAHGISIQGGSSNVKITNCEIGYIGGSYMTHTSTSTTRFGNGVEIWCAGSDITVDNCWVHQIYDTGLTHQGTATVNSGSLFTQKNITFSNNLIEYCALASIEYWTSASGSATEYNWFDNINYTNNICRFAGYGFGTQGVTRTGYHLYTSKAALNAITADGSLDTFYVSGNIFDTARGGLMQLAGCHYVSALPQLSGNTYMQNEGGVIGELATQFSDGTTSGTTIYYADSDAQTTIASTFKDTDGTVVVY